MTFKQFIILMLVATVILWGSWFWSVVSIDPFQTNLLGFLLFYLVLFLALLGSFTLLGVFIRKIRMVDNLLFSVVLLSFRQSVILSLFFIFLLVLQSQRLLRWWILLILLVCVLLIELYVVSKERKHYPEALAKLASTETEVLPVFTKKEIEETIAPLFSQKVIVEEDVDHIN